MKKVLEIITSKGAKIRFEAEYHKYMGCPTADADGDILTFAAEPIEEAMMAVYVNGKMIDFSRSCWDWGLTEDKNGMKIIGMKIVLADPVDAQKYEEFVENLVAEGTDAEVVAYEKKVAEKEKARMIKRALELIAEAEKLDYIPTEKEAKQKRKEYNDFMNEGGEGYIPAYLYITKEAYEQAKERVAQKGRK